jgi:hypothetical protein
MFNHTHATTLDETRQRITLFQRQVGVSTAHTYNREYGREGREKDTRQHSLCMQ